MALKVFGEIPRYRQIVISIANSPSDIGLTDRQVTREKNQGGDIAVVSLYGLFNLTFHISTKMQCFSEIHERLVAGNGNSCTTLGLTAGKVVFILRCLLCYAAALPDKTA